MAITIGDKKYVPGMFGPQKITGYILADNYFRELDKKLIEKEKSTQQPAFYPTICFSRKIGVGALEVAHLLADRIGYHVVDRELLTEIAKKEGLTEKTVAYFDERYPGRINELLRFLFGEKSFINSDYSNRLFSTVISISALKPTLFVGRGTHLILPRDRVLAVRFIASAEYRINRMAKLLEASESDVALKLAQIDKEQSDFFKKVFDKNDASPYEFDLIINIDYLDDPQMAADIIETAFLKKFQKELEKF